MSGTRHQMTCATGERVAMSVLDDLRRGRMLVREPVRRISQIIDLCAGKVLRAAGKSSLPGRLSRQRAINDGECPIGILACWSLRLSRHREHKKSHEKDCDLF